MVAENPHWCDRWWLYCVPVILVLLVVLFQLFVIQSAVATMDGADVSNVLRQRMWSIIAISAGVTSAVMAILLFQLWRKSKNENNTLLSPPVQTAVRYSSGGDVASDNASDDASDTRSSEPSGSTRSISPLPTYNRRTITFAEQ